MLFVPDGEMTEAEQVCFDAGWATPLQATTMRDALREIANHGDGPLGHVVNVTKLSDALAQIARTALDLSGADTTKAPAE